MSKEKILAAIKEGLADAPQNKGSFQPSTNGISEELRSLTPATSKELMLQFKQELGKISGEFSHCHKIGEITEIISGIMAEQSDNRILISYGEHCQYLSQSLRRQNKGIDIVDFTKLNPHQKREAAATVPVALVQGSYAVADIGAVVSLQEKSKTTLPHFLAETLIVVIPAAKICANLHELFENVKKGSLSDMVLIAGPSRTADIEQVLVLGAHGPKRVVVISFSEKEKGDRHQIKPVKKLES